MSAIQTIGLAMPAKSAYFLDFIGFLTGTTKNMTWLAFANGVGNTATIGFYAALSYYFYKVAKGDWRIVDTPPPEKKKEKAKAGITAPVADIV